MTTATEAPLLFNWGPPRPRARAIVLFIGASLLLHAFCFYLFQITYPPTVVLQPPPARISFISDKSEDGRAWLRWIDAEDPALISATLRPPDSKTRALPALPHTPSYMTEQVPLKELPPLIVDLRAPTALPPGPVPSVTPQTPSQRSINKTGAAFSEEIEELGAATLPDKKFSAGTNEQPDNVRFRIAVNGHGETQYSFPLNSSGDRALDEQAREFVALTRFPARSTSSDQSLVWGIATVEWGNDVAFPPARPGESVESRTRSTSTSTPP